MAKSVEEILAMVPATLLRGHRDDTKFAPKLSFEQRCEVMAFYLAGFKIPALAAAFGLHRRTVSSIVSRNARYYKDVIEEFDRRGADDFKRVYLTEEGAKKLAAVADSDEVKMNEPAYRGLKATADGPDKRKNTYQGVSTSSQGGKFEVAWKDKGEVDAVGELEESGWYYHDLEDPVAKGMWQVDSNDKPFVSSKAAYDKAMIEVRQH